MRNIKFRAWVIKGGAMADWDTMVKECDRLSILKDQNFIFMQYTGLKDKNGTEIYEGDILSFRGEVLEPVTFECAEYIAGRFALSPQAPMSDEVFEVIGNIHENPSLIQAA